MQRIKTDISGFDNLLLPIFNRCSNLTYLELSTFIIDDEGLFIDSLRNNLRQLLRLSIISFRTRIKGLRQAVRLESALPLLHVCLLHPQLRELDLAFEILSSKQPDPVQEEWKGRQYTSILEDLNNLSDSTGPFRSNITSLTLPTFYFGYPLSFLEPLLIDHVVNIERLTLPMIEINDGEFDKDNFNHDVEIEYYSRFCPKLQHLACIFGERNYNQRVIMAFIDRCGLGLKSCRIGFMNDRYYFDILQHLLYSYSDILEEIDIYDCEMACSHSLQRVFSSCDKLRRFRLSLAPDGHVNMRIPELVAEEWVCLEMRELHLELSRDSVLNVELSQDSVFYDTSEAQARQIIENLYIQIGRLVKLEELYLNYSDRDNGSDLQDHKDDLTLERGFLGQLKGLSMIWHFHMAMDLWSNMGRAEVEFIHANWTHLERISFGIPSYMGKDTIENKPHWRWLKKQRPTLSLEYKEYK
ncbi:hypothetical protein BGZ49_007802 [Haplosporangium sp. Z 27]|nr:hypothetical protein BGZ49_007802 [Haplosporangium sp. Z 27]